MFQKPPNMSDEQWQQILNQQAQQQNNPQFMEQEPPRLIVDEVTGINVNHDYYNRLRQEQIRLNNVMCFSELRLIQLERTAYQERLHMIKDICTECKVLLDNLLYCNKETNTYRFIDTDLIENTKQLISKLESIEGLSEPQIDHNKQSY